MNKIHVSMSRSLLGLPSWRRAIIAWGVAGLVLVGAWLGAGLPASAGPDGRVAELGGQAGSPAVGWLQGAEQACPDPWEPDDTAQDAQALAADGTAARHTLEQAADKDWHVFKASTEQQYTITTFNLLLDTDTVLRLYDSDGKTLLQSNDDFPGAGQPYASQIVWVPPVDGSFYIMVKDFYNRGGCLGYDVNITSVPVVLRSYLTQVEAQAPTTPVPTSTPTPTATATATPTATPTPVETPTPTATPPVGSEQVAVPGLDNPLGIAANPEINRLYVASRDNDRLFVLDGATHAVLGQVPTGDRPFGVAANPATNKVYVASYQDGKLTVVDGATNQTLKTLTLAPELTYVAVNPALKRVYVVSHKTNKLYVLNGDTDAVIREVNTGQPGAGAFGLAVSETLNRVYVGNRDSQDIFVFDGEGSVLPGQQVKPVPVGAVPFAMGFNPLTKRLYVMVGPDNRVDRVQVFQASAGGLSLVAKIQVDQGGEDGGGGVAVDTTANRIVVSNAAADTASVIDGDSDRLITTLATGDDPFGVAFNAATGAIYVGNRLSDDLTLVRGQ